MPRPCTHGGRLKSAFAVCIAAGLLVWPALFNRFPLLYPDSVTYLEDGKLVALALFLHRFSAYYGMRSATYSLGIFPFHWQMSLWPVVVLQSLLTAYVLFCLVRALFGPGSHSYFFAVVVMLSVSSGVVWAVSLILPDILGPLVYLSIFLIVFAKATLSRLDHWLLYAVCWWGICSHASHLLVVAAILLTLLPLVAVLPTEKRKSRLGGLAETVALTFVAISSQLALHGYLYHRLTLNPDRPPYLTARLIADGPGLTYLKENCAKLRWVVCSHMDRVSTDPDNFLWGSDGVVENLSSGEQDRMVAEEPAFLMATVGSYPRQEAGRALSNLVSQLNTFGLEDLDPSDWVRSQLQTSLPHLFTGYSQSRQSANALPLEGWTKLERWAMLFSILLLSRYLMALPKSSASQLIAWLAVTVAIVVLANAFVCVTLSMVEDRLQARVAWLIPLLAVIHLLAWIHETAGARENALFQPEIPEFQSTLEVSE